MKSEVSSNVWDALADNEQEAANLKARSALMHAVRKAVESWDIPQAEAAQRLGMTRPRLNDLLRGKLAKFSLDALVNIATAARLRIEIKVRKAA
ncbi:XRE family transcriptional regulator [Tardiphaga alba]|uniref:XRE family transcriptional regulator n=1 Tax=Tardiphaga alba TaxID=340268 RepID=A0ABX8AGF1_9BRAD|nr:XRE family transcriptional regulator [Tardiphaga alba]QUS42381.1 XRE family transcriptional regulator [Tardiphaga alba]